MEDLITWLRGVLDDIEAAAKAAAPGPWQARPGGMYAEDDEWEIIRPQGNLAEASGYVVFTGLEGGGVANEENAHFIVLHDPEQVLADVAAKRAILELHAQSVRWVGFPRADRQESYCVHDQQGAPCHTVRLLASGYRHRPGWRDSWGA